MPTKIEKVNNKTVAPTKKPQVTVKVSEISQSAIDFLNSRKAKKIRQVVFRCFFLTFAAVFFTFYFLDKYVKGGIKFVRDLKNVHEVKDFGGVLYSLLNTITLIIVVLTVLYVIAFVLRIFAGGSKRRKTVLSMVSSCANYVGYIVLVMLILSAWGVNTATLLASVGVIGLIIGLGCQSLISDILSGVFLVCENNIQVGDMITFEGFRGEVVYIGIRVTRTKSPTGDINVINNSELRNFINMSKHRSLALSDIRIAYGEDLEKAEKLIKEALPIIARKLTVITEGPTYLGVQEYTELGLVLRISAKCAEEDRLQLIRNMNREFKLLFDKHKIKIGNQIMEIKK